MKKVDILKRGQEIERNRIWADIKAEFMINGLWPRRPFKDIYAKALEDIIFKPEHSESPSFDIMDQDGQVKVNFSKGN